MIATLWIKLQIIRYVCIFWGWGFRIAMTFKILFELTKLCTVPPRSNVKLYDYIVSRERTTFKSLTTIRARHLMLIEKLNKYFNQMVLR